VRKYLQNFVDVEPGLRRARRRIRHRDALIHGYLKTLFQNTSSQNGLKIILYGLRPKVRPHTAGGEAHNMPGKKKAAATRPAPAQSRSDSRWSERLRYFEARQQQIVDTIREFAAIESPSDNKLAADRMGALLASRFEALGGQVRIHPAEHFADSVQIDFPGHDFPRQEKLSPVLLLGHFDTVYSVGTLEKMPCHIADGKLYGPGVLDMKSGIALMLYAIQALQAEHSGLPRPVTVLLVSDEEVGSHSSRKITESLAMESAAVLVLEPAASRGAVKTARKGVGEYILKVNGIAAHAGLDPGKGHSAIVELSKQIVAISRLNDLRRGLSVNAGVIRGGTRTNVIAAEATVEIDVRIQQAKQAAMLDRKFRSLKPFDKHCQIHIKGGINRMPMERTAGVAALYKKAQAIAKEMNWKLEEAAVGGGSDGNFTAALGVPTLDGMGGVGQGAHALHEHVVISELPRRALLLSAMIETA
jgi:glutamate carboxypeptidase